MHTHKETNGDEIFMMLTDLFMMLFLVAIMMIGQQPALMKTADQGQNSADTGDTYLNLYATSEGALFISPALDQDNMQALTTAEIKNMINPNSNMNVALYVPDDLQIGKFAELQKILYDAQAKKVRFVTPQ